MDQIVRDISSFSKMFGLFADFVYVLRHVVRAYDPFFGYYYEQVWRNYHRLGINSLGADMHPMDQAFNQMFGYDMIWCDIMMIMKRKSQKSQRKKNQEEPKA